MSRPKHPACACLAVLTGLGLAPLGLARPSRAQTQAVEPVERQPNPVAANELRALSFNIRYGKANDGANSWPHRKELVRDTIRRHDPHVVGLQEALAFQVHFLRQELQEFDFVGQGRDGGTRGEYAGILFRSDRLELLSHGDFWLSPEPSVVASVGWDAALTRMVTWALFRDRRSDTCFKVWNTHFDHRGGEARTQSGALIASRVARSPFPDLLLGDLNAGEDSAALEHLRAAGLRDTYRDQHPETTTVGTFGGFQGRTSGAKIDYVMVDRGFTTASARIDTWNEGGRYPSDHYPVAATVRFVRPGPLALHPVILPKTAGREANRRDPADPVAGAALNRHRELLALANGSSTGAKTTLRLHGADWLLRARHREALGEETTLLIAERPADTSGFRAEGPHVFELLEVPGRVLALAAIPASDGTARMFMLFDSDTSADKGRFAFTELAVDAARQRPYATPAQRVRMDLPEGNSLGACRLGQQVCLFLPGGSGRTRVHRTFDEDDFATTVPCGALPFSVHGVLTDADGRTLVLTSSAPFGEERAVLLDWQPASEIADKTGDR